MKSRILAITAALIFLTSCLSVEPPTNTPAPAPSETPILTPTLRPSETPSKTSTSMPPAELNYSFSLDKEIVNVIWNEDGSLSLTYEFSFSNDTNALPIDFVDVAIPYQNVSLQDISADVNGQTVFHIMESTYVPNAVELGLEENAIPPGGTGVVSARIDQIPDVLYTDPTDEDQVIAIFFPTWFGTDFTHGTTDMTVIFHLPPDVKPGESSWHQTPPDWPGEPTIGLSERGRITYTWQNPEAEGYTQYLFGVSFLGIYIPESAIILPNQLDPLFAAAYINRGFFHGDIGEWQKAISDLSRSIEIDPTNVYTYLLRSAAYGNIGEWDKAISDLNRCIETDSTNAYVYYVRGAVNAEVGENESAISDLERALELGLDLASKYAAEALLDELKR